MGQTVIHLPLEGFTHRCIGDKLAYTEDPWKQLRFLPLSRSITESSVDDVIVIGTLHEMRKFLSDALASVEVEIQRIGDASWM